MNKKYFFTTLTASIFLPLPIPSYGSSFQILEQSPAHLGKAFAGTASDIADATSVFFCPAGIGELQGRQLTIGGNAIFTKAEFNDINSNTNGVIGETDETGYVPNIYVVTPIAEQWTLGLGVNVPYGLASDYNDAWIGRYLATYSELEVVNVGAVLALRLNADWSIGLGVDYQRAKVTLESQVDSTLGINPSPAADSSATIKGDDDDVSANVSLYFSPTDETSLGLVWRENGDFDLEGSARFNLNAICSPGAGHPTGVATSPTTGTLCAGSLNALGGNASAEMHLPDTITLSGSHKFYDNFWLHADIAWTQWSDIQTVNVINNNNQGSINQLQLNYENSMRYAIGFTCKSSVPWTWRFGIAFDEAPQTDPVMVSPRIPDQDRIWFSGGFNYAFSSDISVDAGYTYIKVKEININNTDALTGHHVQGDFDADVNIVGVQGNWRF